MGSNIRANSLTKNNINELLNTAHPEIYQKIKESIEKKQ